MGFWRRGRRWGGRPRASLSRALSVESLENRRLLSADVGANIAPKAEADRALTFGNLAVLIDVVQNDHDPNGTIDPTTVRVRSGPQLGTATVRADGSVVYTPPLNRFGVDKFSYTVENSAGAVSNLASVLVAIRSIWQNQENPLDVNNDGSFSPLDILRVVHELNAGGARFLTHPPSPPVMPPPFLDVNGDGYLTSADAVFAISCLNGNISGESMVSWPAGPADSFSGISTLPAEGGAPTSGELPVGSAPGGVVPGGEFFRTQPHRTPRMGRRPTLTTLSTVGRIRLSIPRVPSCTFSTAISHGTSARGWASIVKGNPLLASGIEGLELL